jgi:hypothetical protein
MGEFRTAPRNREDEACRGWELATHSHEAQPRCRARLVRIPDHSWMPDFVAPQLVSDGAVVIVVFPRELLFPKLLAWPCPRSAVAHTRNFPPLKKSGGRRPAVNTLVGYASPPMTRASRENRTPTFDLGHPPAD